MAKAKKEQHSWQYNATMTIMQETGKDMWLRVKHPVRFEMGSLCLICVDLFTTYNWNAGQVLHFVKFAR